MVFAGANDILEDSVIDRDILIAPSCLEHASGRITYVLMGTLENWRNRYQVDLHLPADNLFEAVLCEMETVEV